MKGVLQAVGRYIPAFGNSRLYFQAVIHLYQSVKQLVVHPDGILIAAKGRIKRGKAFIKVDIEYCLMRIGVMMAA
jgi:hypothetical protein